MPRLLFVYNADSGLFNILADIGHKLFSPQTYHCDLCMLTHGVLREREAWRDFIETLPVETRFLHRDEFRREYPKVRVKLPAVFVEREGEIRQCLNARALHDCRNLDDLKEAIRLACLSACKQESP